MQGGPMLCEYTGGLFCRSCHTGRTARLPCRALHAWDFTPRPGTPRPSLILSPMILLERLGVTARGCTLPSTCGLHRTV